eukprot:TRINITY_DN1858_c0_g1_i6.p1 TRINITY_DN1858_c0_g1~~TRINITY_DN1858_c0_g1_i6.p1  ORF type:complete len:116 (+),score=23.34 TRINITY_DN1858_c0_g1_i6:385-732(+)
MLGLTRLALAQFLLISSCAAFCLHLASKKPGMFGVAYVLFSLSLGFVTGMLLMRVYLMASFGLPLYHDMLPKFPPYFVSCLLYTSDAADEEDSVDLGGRRIIKKKKRTGTQKGDA